MIKCIECNLEVYGDPVRAVSVDGEWEAVCERCYWDDEILRTITKINDN